MATIRVICPSDGHPFLVNAELKGRTIRCPHCRTAFTAAHVEPAEVRTPAAPLSWGDLLLFTGMGLLVIVALVYWGLRWSLGIDLLPFP
jgi:hypothetical protein